MLITMGANGYGTYLLFGSFGVAMWFFVYFFIPETKGKSMAIILLLRSYRYLVLTCLTSGVALEQMDALFGVADEQKLNLVKDHEIHGAEKATHVEVSAEPTGSHRI